MRPPGGFPEVGTGQVRPSPWGTDLPAFSGASALRISWRWIMRMDKCPGSFARKLDGVLVVCPACGREVEIFTDEPKRTCRCGNVLRREARPTCAEWCPAAAQCLGEQLDAEEHKRRLAAVKDDPRAEEYVECIRRRVAEKSARRPPFKPPARR